MSQIIIMMKKWLTWINFSQESQDVFCAFCLELLKQISQCGSELKAIQKKKWMFGAMRIIEKVWSGEVSLNENSEISKVVSLIGLGLANDQSKKLPQKNQKKTWGYYWRRTRMKFYEYRGIKGMKGRWINHSNWNKER